MFKKIFAIATVLCIIPMMANAATKWQFGTRVMTNGGTITSSNGTSQTVTDGMIFKAVTTDEEFVALTPATGFKILKYAIDGAVTVPQGDGEQVIALENPQPGAARSSVQVWFARNGYTLTATTTGYGSVNKSSFSPVYAGPLNPPKTLIFTPATIDNTVTDIKVNGVSLSASTSTINILDSVTGLPLTLPYTNPANRVIKVQVDILNIGNANMTVAVAFGGTAPATDVVSANCEACHATQGVGPSVFNAWSTSVHGRNNPVIQCYQCHMGAEAANHPGSLVCATCHTDKAANTRPGDAAKCAACHTSLLPGQTAAKGSDIHRATTGGASTSNDCVGCHEIGFHQSSDATSNQGVRAIVGEFAKRSHHVTGRAVKNSDCVACHMEGKAASGAIVIDTNFHYTDGKIYLRNGNTTLTGNQTEATNDTKGNYYAWNPETPNHTLMDQFCFSCHNASGAPAAAAALAGVAGYTGTALNPFGDSVSNSYDQVSRINVVGVYEQFATTNSSHHAVRGAKYTSNTLSAATFSNISTTNYNFVEMGISVKTKGVRAITGTMSSLTKFESTYTTLNGVALADNNTLHCGDCHTVGQFRASDVNLASGFNKAVIGAHGSNNEYMLRNSNGNDTFAKDALVCYICHKYSEYGASTSVHNGTNSEGVHCNGDVYNTAGLNGIARLAAEEGWLDGVTPISFREEVAEGSYGATGGAAIFGIKCINCHNASDAKTFGGIHGNANNASYQTYSGAKSSTSVQSSTVVSRKPYRFMPGLGNFRYNGGDNADAWTLKSLTTANKQGCYTLNGTKTRTVGGVVVDGVQPTKAELAGTNVSPNALADDNGILGAWGACTDHAGTSYQGGRGATRTILRPLTY